MKLVIPAVATLMLLLTGCVRHTTVEPNASPALDSKAACQAAGGEWHAATHHCDKD